MKLYLAGPLFTLAERSFNCRLADKLIERGHEVWLPQEHEPREKTADAIFQMDVEGMDWSDCTVACMDGSDPDSGTCWEVGYTYAKGKPIVCYRTDFRNAGDIDNARYNLMLHASAWVRIESQFSSLDELVVAIDAACFMTQDERIKDQLCQKKHQSL